MRVRVLAALTLVGVSGGAPLGAQEPAYRTPRAGERVEGTLFGKPVVAETRDRARITYLNVGAALLLDGPDGLGLGPAGGLYLWRATPSGRLRAIVSGIANEVRWDRGRGPLYGVATLDTLTLPWARSEYRRGERLRSEELEWHQARAGAGLAWRRPLGPGAVDNVLDVALALEGGGLWFARGSHTAADFHSPGDAFEGRLHLRVRADALERNLVELPHAGWAAGIDVVGARRARWEGRGAADALETGGRSWSALSGFAFLAFGPPGLSERHRLIAALHAGVGSDLDRFSRFRLGSGSTWGDFETLSRAVVPAAGVDEIATSRYAITELEYRWEALFFLYLQLRGSLALCDVPGRRALPALTAGLTTGLPWKLALELAASYGFGLETVRDGTPEKGRAGILVSLTREF